MRARVRFKAHAYNAQQCYASARVVSNREREAMPPKEGSTAAVEHEAARLYSANEVRSQSANCVLFYVGGDALGIFYGIRVTSPKNV